MASTPMRGAGIGLPNYPGLYTPPGGVTVFNNEISLQAGQIYFPPAGQWVITPGPYTFVQFKDPITGLWRNFPNAGNAGIQISTDGVNVRMANLTGFVVGVSITNVGSAYTSAPTVTGGGATYQAIIGGTVNTTVTVGTAGAGYVYPPMVIFSPPPVGGVQATGIAVLSAATLGSITVVDQGAGYLVAPTITIIPDPRDVATGAVTTTALATCALTGAGTISAILVTNHGATVQTSVPSLTISGGGGSSGAATAVMCFAVTGAAQGTAGVAYSNSSAFQVRSFGGVVTASTVAKQPSISTGLFVPRTASLVGTASAGGAIGTTQLSAASIVDAGLTQGVPSMCVDTAGSLAATTLAAVTATVGGSPVDVSTIQPI